MERLPVVDFSCLSLEKEDASLQAEDLSGVAGELMKAFTTIGFVYLTNHGVDKEQVEGIHRLSHEFFSQTVDVKEKYHRTKPHGYTRFNEELLSPNGLGDMKECYDVCPMVAEIWPSEVPNFESRAMEFYSVCEKLAERILLAIATGLGVKMEDLFMIRQGDEYKSYTNLRMLYYPPLPEDVQAGSVRLGEHTDYGAFTILFQDDIGGLEVKTSSGDWVNATPVPGTVLINIADMMQRWTSDKLKSTPHRVTIPREEIRRKTCRFSTAFFVHPSTDTVIKSLDDTNKYPPIKAANLIKERYLSSYKEYVAE